MEIGSVKWLKNQIKEFEEEYETQSDSERCMFIDGKLTILKLWLHEKTFPKKDVMCSLCNQETMCKKHKIELAGNIAKIGEALGLSDVNHGNGDGGSE